MPTAQNSVFASVATLVDVCTLAPLATTRRNFSSLSPFLLLMGRCFTKTRPSASRPIRRGGSNWSRSTSKPFASIARACLMYLISIRRTSER